MKLLHTSDWHLGKRLDDFPRITEQQAVLQEICEIADREQVDAIILAGDLFDTFNPPTDAVDLLYKTLKRLTNQGRRPVIAIAGNHDSPDRIESPDPLARECGIIFAGYPDSRILPFELDSGLKVLRSEEGFLEIQMPDTDVPLRILLTPYANEYRIKTWLGVADKEEELGLVLRDRWSAIAGAFCDDRGVNILATHLFMVRRGDELPEEPEDEKPILHVGGVHVLYTEMIPPQIQYTALGHLHRMHRVDQQPKMAYYSGSPLSYSFAEANQDKFVLVVEADPGMPAVVREVQLSGGKRLLRKRAEGLEDALVWLSDHQKALVELTLVTETFLTAMERRQIQNAHPGIVAIIPEISGGDFDSGSQHKQIDLSRSMEELFRDYFRHEKGQDPNQEIMDLFTEILSSGDE